MTPVEGLLTKAEVARALGLYAAWLSRHRYHPTHPVRPAASVRGPRGGVTELYGLDEVSEARSALDRINNGSGVRGSNVSGRRLMTLREAAEAIGVHYCSLSRRRSKDPAFLPAAEAPAQMRARFPRRNDLFFRPVDVRAAARSVAEWRRGAQAGKRVRVPPRPAAGR